MSGKKTAEKKEEMIKVDLAEIDRKRMEYRWGMESFFRSHEIEADKYKEALERYRESCLIFMSEKDIKKIKDTKKIKVKRIPFINLHKIRREKPLGRWMASACFKNCGINENRYKKELEAYNQACRLHMKPEEIAVIAEKLPCDVSDFSNSENIVYLLEIRNKMNEKTLKELFDKCGIDIKKYKNELYKQACAMQKNPEEIKETAEKLKTKLKKLENLQQQLNLLNIDSNYKKLLEDFLVKDEAEINEYEDEIYKQAIILRMEPEEIEMLVEKLPCGIPKFAFFDDVVDLSEIRRMLEETTLKEISTKLKEIFAKYGIDINKYEEVSDVQDSCIEMNVKEVKKLEEALHCCAKEFSEFKNPEYIVNLSKVKKRIEKNILKRLFFTEYGIDINKYEEVSDVQDSCFKMNVKEFKKLEEALHCCVKEFSEFKNSECIVNLSEVKQRIEENILKRFFDKCRMDTDEYDQAIQVYEKSGFIKAEKADIKKIEQNMNLQEERFIKNAVDLLDIQRQLKVYEPEDIEQNLKDCGIEIQNYEEELKAYKKAFYLTMKEDDIKKLAKSLQCKKEEIEIKKNRVNLLQIEEKIEKIAREKWSTLEGFFESIGVQEDYRKEIERYENQYFIECSLHLIDKISSQCGCKWEDLVCGDEKKKIKDVDYKVDEEMEKKYKVRVVELERRKKALDYEWQEPLYGTLNLKLLEGVDEKEKKEIKKIIDNFERDCGINMDNENLRQIADAVGCEKENMHSEDITVDLRKFPGLDIEGTSNVNQYARENHIGKDALYKKARTARKEGDYLVSMKRSTANQIAKRYEYKLKDLQPSLADEVKVVKDEINEKLLPFPAQIKVQILIDLCIPELDLLIQESEQRERKNSRIEYLKTEEEYEVTIYFNGEEYDVGNIPKADQEDDIEEYLIDTIREWLLNEKNLDEENIKELYDEFEGLTIVNVEEDKDYQPFFMEKCRQLFNRMGADGKTLDDRRRVLRNEKPFTQDMCDYYEVPNPFNIEK